MRGLALFGVLSLVGCANGEGDVLSLDVRDPELTVLVQRAADGWNACGAAVVVGPGVPVVWEDPGYNIDGLATRNTESRQVVLIQVRPGHPSAQRIVSHEIGHALGVPHAERGVMRAVGPDQRDLPGPEDCAAFRAR